MRIVVIGLGNPMRGDDAAGIEVVRRLHEAGASSVELVEHDGEPLELLDRWVGADVAYVVDAVAGPGPAGTVHSIEVGNEPIPDRPQRDSTHAIGLGDAIELARALGQLPRRLVLIGIEGESFAAGTELTPPVARAVEDVASDLASTARVLTRKGDR